MFQNRRGQRSSPIFFPSCFTSPHYITPIRLIEKITTSKWDVHSSLGFCWGSNVYMALKTSMLAVWSLPMVEELWWCLDRFDINSCRTFYLSTIAITMDMFLPIIPPKINMTMETHQFLIADTFFWSGCVSIVMLVFGGVLVCCAFGKLDFINILGQMKIVALDGVSEIDTTKNHVRNYHELSLLILPFWLLSLDGRQWNEKSCGKCMNNIQIMQAQLLTKWTHGKKCQEECSSLFAKCSYFPCEWNLKVSVNHIRVSWR